MVIEIQVPQVSDGVTFGTVISLAVAVGDTVTEDQTLLELETDKAVVAIPSPRPGTVRDIRVGEGDQAQVGAVIMLLETADAGDKMMTNVAPQQDQALVDEATQSPATEEEIDLESVPSIKEERQKADAPPLDLIKRRSPDLVAPAAPSVRRIARELGVDIYQIQGSGPGGRISEGDVRAFVRETMEQLRGGVPVSASEFRGLHAQRPLPDFAKWGEVERKPLSKIRQVTADAMGYAWSTIPMVTQYDSATIDGPEKYRRNYNSGAPEVKLTMTAILLKICAAALKTFPQFNSSLDLAEQELIYKNYVHIGVAVDTNSGLLVPVVRDADKKGMAALAAELNELADKARQRQLSPAQMEGGTFTISNLGGIGGTSFTPIVYAPQVAILGVSRTETRPVWNGREFVPKQMMPLSLSYDHRVIDGADGARFLRWICEALEQPLRVLM